MNAGLKPLVGATGNPGSAEDLLLRFFAYLVRGVIAQRLSQSHGEASCLLLDASRAP